MNTPTSYKNDSGQFVVFSDSDTYPYAGPDYQLRKLVGIAYTLSGKY